VLWRALAGAVELRNPWRAFGEGGKELWQVQHEDLCGGVAHKALWLRATCLERIPVTAEHGALEVVPGFVELEVAVPA
jgi:hypothetical protein